MAAITNSIQTNHNVIEKLTSSLECPISREPMTDPVIDRCGHTFERAAIHQKLRIRPLCPISGNPLSAEMLGPNLAAREASALLNRLQNVAPAAMEQPANLTPQEQDTLRKALSQYSMKDLSQERAHRKTYGYC